MRYPTTLALFLLASMSVADTDRYAPMAEDAFFFHRIGESREYTVTPKFYSATEVALLSSSDDFPRGMLEKDPPRWRIKAQAFRAGKLTQQMYLKPKAGWPGTDDHQHYRAVSLGSFSAVDFEFFPKPVKIRLTVEDIDDRYVNARPTVRVVIRTSPIP